MATFLRKALARVTAEPLTKASKGAISGYVPQGSNIYGQPRIESGTTVTGLITPQRMREIVLRTPTAAACVNAILDYATNVEIKLRNVDASKPRPPRQSLILEALLQNPNDNDSAIQFRQKLYRDLIVLGNAAIEIELDQYGDPFKLWPLDMARIAIDFDEHGTVLGYDMLNSAGMPIKGADGVHAFRPDQVIYFSRNPVTSSLYSASQLVQLYTCAIIEDMMISFIGGRFTESNTPYGVFDMGDITTQEVNRAIEYWNNQVTSGHKILLTGSKGSKWYPFGYHLKDLEAKELLAEVRGKIMAIMGVTMNELGESQNINKSNGYSLSYTFKKRAIEPVLNEFCATVTKRLIHDELSFPDLEIYYEEIDSRDELLQAQIDEMYFRNGIWTVNDIRNRKGLTSVDNGDIPMVFTGSAFLPVDMLDDFAHAQLLDLQAVYQQTQIAIQQAQVQLAMQLHSAMNPTADGETPPPLKPPEDLISLPLTRPPKMPESFSTPDGSGNTTAKVKYPKPQLAPVNANSPSQAPRGPVQANRAQGNRQEQTS